MGVSFVLTNDAFHCYPFPNLYLFGLSFLISFDVFLPISSLSLTNLQMNTPTKICNNQQQQQQRFVTIYIYIYDRISLLPLRALSNTISFLERKLKNFRKLKTQKTLKRNCHRLTKRERVRERERDFRHQTFQKKKCLIILYLHIFSYIVFKIITRRFEIQGQSDFERRELLKRRSSRWIFPQRIRTINSTNRRINIVIQTHM